MRIGGKPMNISVGQTLITQSGKKLKILDFIEEGGQGRVYKGKLLGSNQNVVAKFFLATSKNKTLQKRIEFLIKLNLTRKCPTFQTPIDMIIKGSQIGHYTPFVSGKVLDDYLTAPNSLFISHIILALALAQSVEVLHNQNIVHGDLQARNVIINNEEKFLRLFMIDLDNFKAPGLPSPDCLGHQLYMAPELWDSLRNKTNKVPDFYTDRFALAVLLHELLLLKHPATGADHDERKFRIAMCSGKWFHDPSYSTSSSGDLGGWPSNILNAEICQLFRRAFSLDITVRPTAKEWVEALCKTLSHTFLCPYCSCPCLVDPSKKDCPLCNSSYPILKIILPDRKTITLNKPMILGRSTFANAMTVSQKHAIIKKNGPEVLLIPIGMNKTFRKTPSGIWQVLKNNVPVILNVGDQLKFADQLVRIAIATNKTALINPYISPVKRKVVHSKDKAIGSPSILKFWSDFVKGKK